MFIIYFYESHNLQIIHHWITITCIHYIIIHLDIKSDWNMKFRNIIVTFFITCFFAIVGRNLLLYQVIMVLLPTESEPVIYVIRTLYMYAVICFVRCMKYHYSLKLTLWYIVFVIPNIFWVGSRGEKTLARSVKSVALE